MLFLKVGRIQPPSIELQLNKLQERIEYHAHHLTRHQMPRRLALLMIRPSRPVPKGTAPVPLLPILSPSANALDESGLLPYVDHPVSTTGCVEDQATGAAAHLLSPDGPWHLHGSMKLPEHVMHISTKHPESNTTVRHCLKFFLRVERGDENDLDSKGHKKQYDIIVEMPVAILSVGATFISYDATPTSRISTASLSNRAIYLASI